MEMLKVNKMELFYKYLDDFMPSEEMREYLKREGLPAFRLLEIIYGSPCSMEKKLAGVKQFLTETEYFPEDDFRDIVIEDAQTCIHEIESALNHLNTEGTFTVKAGCFDNRTLHFREELEMVCTSFSDVKEYVAKRDEEEGLSKEDLYWYDIIKWEKNPEGKMEEIGDYVMVNGEVWYAAMGLTRDCWPYDLSLPVPYKIGDIVEIDGYPFAPKMRSLIVDTGDNWDCCCLQGISRRADGKWIGGAIKHGEITYDKNLRIPPLYRIRLCREELQDSERLLYSLRDYLMKHGEDYWKIVMRYSGADNPMTDGEIETLLQNIDGTRTS